MELFLRPRDSITFITLALLLAFAHGQIRQSPRSHYEDMSCTPLPDKTNVRAYKCLFEENHPNKCVYKGKLYNKNQRLPDSDCTAACYCYANPGSGSPDFQCSEVECGEFLSPRNRSCVYQYNLDECCSYEQICDIVKIYKLFTCKVDGEVYREGEVFYPANTCKYCVCSKGFSGQYVEPYCKNIDCGVEKRNAFIKYRPAAVYLDNSTCCPEWWNYHEETDKIVRVGARSPYQCTYGDQKLNINDRVVTTNPCLSCSCDYPPLVTCIQDSDCVF